MRAQHLVGSGPMRGLTYGYPGSEADVVDESEDIRGAEVAQAEHRHDHHTGGRGHLAHLEIFQLLEIFQIYFLG